MKRRKFIKDISYCASAMVVYGILQPNNAAGIEAEPSDSVINDLVTSCLSNDNNERKIALKKIKEDSLLSDSVRDEIVRQIIVGLNEKILALR